MLGVDRVTELYELPVELILDQPMHVVLLAEVPNIMSINLHGIGMLGLFEVIKAVPLSL